MLAIKVYKGKNAYIFFKYRYNKSESLCSIDIVINVVFVFSFNSDEFSKVVYKTSCMISCDIYIRHSYNRVTDKNYTR